ncbi:MAG: hypothetical protein ABI685_10885 [Ferruginibacter sp.]
MKKIFTLLFTTAMLSTAFAQYGQKDQRDRGKENDVYVSNDNRGFDKNDKGYGYGGYVFTAKEKNMQIEQISREYAYKIQSVKNKPFMSWFQKKRTINNLEAQRDAEIRQVNDKFYSPKNKFGDYGKKDKKRW